MILVNCNMAYKDTELENEFDSNLHKAPAADYEKAETDLLINALKRSYTERFLITTRLYKIGMMLKNAKVTHRPFTPKQ